MKKFVVFIFLTLSFFKVQSSETFPKYDRINFILDENLKAKKPLLDLFETLDIEVKNDLKDIIKITQRKFLRKKERWEEKEKYGDRRKKLIPIFKKLGMVEEITPQEKTYDYAILLGSLLPNFTIRLSYLLEKWREGIRFHTIVFLGSERPLEKSEKFFKKCDILPSRRGWIFPKELPKNEIEMMKLVFDRAMLPDGMKDLKVIFVEIPMKPFKRGFRRPNTKDTVKMWLKNFNPYPGKCLVISNQPYVGYQDAVLREVLKKDFEIETVGKKANKNTKIVIFLDTMTRWLYEEGFRYGVISKFR
jgi:hypothetical protein